MDIQPKKKKKIKIQFNNGKTKIDTILKGHVEDPTHQKNQGTSPIYP